MKNVNQTVNKSVSRESNFDLLRIICAFAVVVIHVSAQFIGAMTGDPQYVGMEFHDVFNSTLWNVLSRFAVPCFVMLSGAFILANDKIADFSFFYKKSFRKFFLPLLLFSFLYYLYSNILIVGGHFLIQKPDVLSWGVFFEPLLNWLKGVPFYHLWYMYMLVGLYLFAPLLILLKYQIGDKFFERTAWSLLLLSGMFAWGRDVVAYWNPGYCFNYLGYFMLGYVLRKKSRPNNFRGLLYILLGVCVECLIAFLRYEEITCCIEEGSRSWIDPLSPLIILASIFIFYGFALLKIKRSFAFLSGLTFVIYLAHAGILQVIQILSGEHFFNLYDVTGETRFSIPIICILTFTLSALFAYFYEKLNINKHMESIVFQRNKLP